MEEAANTVCHSQQHVGLVVIKFAQPGLCTHFISVVFSSWAAILTFPWLWLFMVAESPLLAVEGTEMHFGQQLHACTYASGLLDLTVFCIVFVKLLWLLCWCHWSSPWNQIWWQGKPWWEGSLQIWVFRGLGVKLWGMHSSVETETVGNGEG